MKTVTVSKSALNPVSLPGMGRSIEVWNASEADIVEMRTAFSTGELFVLFEEEPDAPQKVINLWPNPHALQVTLFIK